MSHTHRHTHTRTPGVQVSIWPPWRPSSPPRPAILKADYFRQITRKTNQKRQLILSSSFRKCPKPPSPPLPACLTTSCPVSGRGGGGCVRGCGFSHTTEPTHLLTNIHTLPVFTTCSGMYRLWPHFMGQTTAIFLQLIIYKKTLYIKKFVKIFITILGYSKL